MGDELTALLDGIHEHGLEDCGQLGVWDEQIKDRTSFVFLCSLSLSSVRPKLLVYFADSPASGDRASFLSRPCNQARWTLFPGHSHRESNTEEHPPIIHAGLLRTA